MCRMIVQRQQKKGIYFAPVDSEGKMNYDESSWNSVSSSNLFRNKPSELNFFVPDSLTEGSYQIVLRTTYLGKDKSRKTMLETVSNAITVKAEQFFFSTTAEIYMYLHRFFGWGSLICHHRRFKPRLRRSFWAGLFLLISHNNHRQFPDIGFLSQA